MSSAPRTPPPPPPVPEQLDIAIRTRPPSPKRLSRKVLMGAGLLGAAIVTFALMSGLSGNRTRRGEGVEQEAVAASGGPAESIAQASSQYGSGTCHAVMLTRTLNSIPPKNSRRRRIRCGRMQRRHMREEGRAPAAHPRRRRRQAPRRSRAPRPSLFNTEADSARTGANDTGNDDRLDARLTPPRSRYEIQAGHVIPAAFVTALNSDLPGRVIAQVTAPVYDSVTGDHLLIPQGARLIGAYEKRRALRRPPHPSRLESAHPPQRLVHQS